MVTVYFASVAVNTYLRVVNQLLHTWNQQHTITGGSIADCNPVLAAASPYLPGCEVISSDWRPPG